MRCPCKGCDRRKLGCHGICEEYKQWSATRHEINRKRYLEQERKNTQSEAATRQITKALKHKRR